MTGDLGALLDLTWKLLLVVGLAVLATRLLRWLSNPTPVLGGALKVLARVGLGSQQNLVVVGVGSKRLLLGVTPQQITVLADLAADDLPVEADATSPAPWVLTFEQALARSMGATRNNLPSWFNRGSSDPRRGLSASSPDEKEL